MNRVPSAAPTRLGPEGAAAVRAAIEQVVQDGPWILGDHVDRFEGEFAAFTGHPQVVGVGNCTAVHYPYLLQEMSGLGLPAVDTPGAAWVRDRMLSLPCFPELTDDEVARVCRALSGPPS
jgi:dTDP-4-amino-4,6-dideoxygalactose transaminase